MKSYRTRAILAAGVAAAAFAAPAAAQEAQSPQAAVVDNTDIIVTAQRREEAAQDVPVVITAFSPEKLQNLNITEPQDFYGNVPSLTVGTQGQATRDVQSFAIRGQATGFLASPGVAVYMAEVPVPAAISLNLQGGPGAFFDLQNVQVLSGPQGTLFGRNTTGGAVLLTPRKPSSEFEGYLEGALGSHDLIGVEGALNVPLSESLMVRVAGAYRDRRGYTKDVTFDKWRDGEHWYSGRIGVLFKPNSSFSNYLLGYYQKSSNNGSGHIHKGFNIPGLQLYGFCADSPATPVPGLGVPCSVYRRQTEIADELGNRQTANSVDAYSRIKTWGIINTTEVDLSDQWRVKNIVSFQKLRDDYAADQDATPLQQYELAQGADFPTSTPPGLAPFGLPLFGYTNAQPDFDYPRDSLKQWTEELQVQGDLLDGKLNVTAGGFYYHASPDRLWGSTANNFCPAAFTGLCALSESYTGVSNKSMALYAQGSLDLGTFNQSLDGLKVTAGYRHTWDTIKGFAYGFRFNAAVPGSIICNVSGLTVPLANAALPEPDGCRFDDTLKSNAPTWTIGVDYKASDDLLLYAKVTRGYKSGGFNTFAVRPSTRTFEPEKLTSYEGGFKSDWRLGDVPLRLNATYFYSDYSNIQRPSGDVTATGVSGAQIIAASATVQGVEGEFSISPTPWLQIGGTVSYTDADYQTFQQVAVANGTRDCDGVVNIGETADYSCRPFQYLPAWIYNINATLSLPVPESVGDVSLFVNYTHVSEQATAPLSDEAAEPGSVLAPYGLLNATLRIGNIAQSGVDVSIFGTNLTNKTYRVSNSNVYAIGQLLTWSTLFGEPRMWGVKLRYSFGK